MPLDTASLSSVKVFAEAYQRAGFGKVYALLLNAGISGAHTGLTEDGYDIMFESNHLGHFLLAKLMLPQMEAEGRIFAKTNFMPLNKLAIESVKHLMPKRFGDLEKSSDAYAELVTMPKLSARGQYFDRSTETCRTSKLSYSEKNAAELWAYSEECVRGYAEAASLRRPDERSVLPVF